MEEKIAFAWRQIEDLPPDWHLLESSELRALADVWNEQKEILEHTATLQDFNERLQREWAIETGVIEHVYTLDKGVTRLLIEEGIYASLIPHSATDKDPELVARIIKDHKEAVEGLFDFVRGRRSLSTGYVKELHALMTQHQPTSSAVNMFGRQMEVPLIHGDYKQLPNNPMRPDGAVHEYCPPEHVTSEMDRLTKMHLEHEKQGVVPEVESAWFHHRFSQIHPFQDGNGRVARALASLILIKSGWFPLVVSRDDRERYIDALEHADQGNLLPLVQTFSAVERRAFVNALSIAGDVLSRELVEHVILAAKEQLQKRQEALWQEWQQAFEIAASLQGFARQRLEQVAAKLESDVGSFFRDHRFWVDEAPADGDRNYYFRGQIIEAAKSLGYYANPSLYRAWTRLVLRTDTQAEVLLSFHGIGHEYRGVLAASVSFFRRVQTEKGEREVTEVTTVSRDVFQFNYRESSELARARFEPWLERGLAKALELWRAGL